MANWFICQHENVKGPFSVEEVKAQVAGGQIPLDCLIWGRGQSEWLSLSHWLKDVEHQRTAAPPAPEQMWHYAVNGSSKGPMPRAQLINEIKALPDKYDVLVWTKGMKAWADLFEFHDLLDEIGLNRREHPRARVAGQVVLKTESGQTVIGQLRSISGGGLGANQIFEPLSIGQSVHVEIRAPELGEPIVAKATVQYITQDAYVGLRFTSLSMESKGRIMHYVKAATTAIAA